MANILQQVGARYITKFYTNSKDGTPRWEEGVAYEALVCVSYKYGAYVSKIPVPADAGDPADNPKYWAEFPNPSMGLWEELRVRLNNEIQDRINGDADLLNKLNAEIARAEEAEKTLTDNLAKEVSDRQTGDTALQTNIDTVNNKLTTEITHRVEGDNLLRQELNTAVDKINTTLSAIVAKFYGSGTIKDDGTVTWGQDGKAAVGNMNVYGNADLTKKIATHDGTTEDDMRVN